MGRKQMEGPVSPNTMWMRARRAEAKACGVELPSNTWWKKNRDAHRANVARWRERNKEKSDAINRALQARRRSTPWGRINNNMWPLMHGGVRRQSSRWGAYNKALGYRWCDLRSHIEAQFTPPMTWENWGDVWEVDHIEPLASFRYESIDCPEFRRAWRLDNLRPLLRAENAAKGAKVLAYS